MQHVLHTALETSRDIFIRSTGHLTNQASSAHLLEETRHLLRVIDIMEINCNIKSSEYNNEFATLLSSFNFDLEFFQGGLSPS
jgi:hypothetical protein